MREMSEEFNGCSMWEALWVVERIIFDVSFSLFLNRIIFAPCFSG